MRNQRGIKGETRKQGSLTVRMSPRMDQQDLASTGYTVPKMDYCGLAQ
jgi:hypothetical protein